MIQHKISIVEWRYGGHRLAYVRSIVNLATQERLGIDLVTIPGIAETPEFRAHLGDAETAGQFTLVHRADFAGSRGLRRALHALKRERSLVIVPEADQYLTMILWAKITRRLPRRLVIIVMRPPRTTKDGVRTIVRRLYRSYKLALLLIMSQVPGIDLLLLEDPLAHGRLRVWRQPILRNERHRLDDPCDLVGLPSDMVPAELPMIESFNSFVAVIGAIDTRKQLPLILDGWMRCDVPSGSGLVVAGKQSKEVHEWLLGVDLPSNVHVLDRYLSRPEMNAILVRSHGLFALQDGGVSSSLIVAAGATGRWAITLNGTRTREVAAINQFGMSCDATPDSVAQAIHRVLQGDPPRGRITPPSVEAFAATVLRGCLSDAEDRD